MHARRKMNGGPASPYVLSARHLRLIARSDDAERRREAGVFRALDDRLEVGRERFIGKVAVTVDHSNLRMYRRGPLHPAWRPPLRSLFAARPAPAAAPLLSWLAHAVRSRLGGSTSPNSRSWRHVSVERNQRGLAAFRTGREHHAVGLDAHQLGGLQVEHDPDRPADELLGLVRVRDPCDERSLFRPDVDLQLHQLPRVRHLLRREHLRDAQVDLHELVYRNATVFGRWRRRDRRALWLFRHSDAPLWCTSSFFRIVGVIRIVRGAGPQRIALLDRAFAGVSPRGALQGRAFSGRDIADSKENL